MTEPASYESTLPFEAGLASGLLTYVRRVAVWAGVAVLNLLALAVFYFGTQQPAVLATLIGIGAIVISWRALRTSSSNAARMKEILKGMSEALDTQYEDRFRKLDRMENRIEELNRLRLLAETKAIQAVLDGMSTGVSKATPKSSKWERSGTATRAQVKSWAAERIQQQGFVVPGVELHAKLKEERVILADIIHAIANGIAVDLSESEGGRYTLVIRGLTLDGNPLLVRVQIGSDPETPIMILDWTTVRFEKSK